MEEDIKLKEAIKLLKEEPDFSLNYYKRENAIDVVLQAIENLIKGYKELESELQYKNDQLFLEDTQWERYIDRNYIPKSALQELLDIDEIGVVHCRLKRLLGDDN